MQVNLFGELKGRLLSGVSGSPDHRLPAREIRWRKSYVSGDGPDPQSATRSAGSSCFHGPAVIDDSSITGIQQLGGHRQMEALMYATQALLKEFLTQLRIRRASALSSAQPNCTNILTE
jgi:hypothetical protein